MNERYLDIIDKPYKKSTKHPHMDLIDRAAQFAPFAALTGYDDEIAEAKRLTDTKQELSEDDKIILNSKINILFNYILERPLVEIIYFIKDNKKDGGKYHKVINNIKHIDFVNKEIILIDKTHIKIEDVYDITSDIFSNASF